MKIINIKTTFLLPVIFAGLIFTGCSNENIVEEKVQEGMGAVSFTISEKDYEPAEEVASTRAAVQAKPEIQDLGDGLQAEVSLEPDTTHVVEPKAKTRAINRPTHYTIQAYQGSVKKGELKGTFNGSTFTPDAEQSNSIFLPHGTYDFVCFNDKVSVNGTQFTVNRTDAATARFTIERNVVINQDPKQYVAFEMRHAGAMVTVELAYINFAIEFRQIGSPIGRDWSGNPIYKAEFVNPAEQYKYKLETSSNSIPETLVYDFSTNTYTYPTMGTISSVGELSALQISGGPYSTGTTSIDFDQIFFDYWLPTTDCSKLKLTFMSGEFYEKSLAGKAITVPTSKLVEANKRYKIRIRLVVSGLYLFSDGTAGPLDKNTGKTPIGVVVNPYKRMAVALNDVSLGGAHWSNSSSQESARPASNYSSLFTELGSINAVANLSSITAIQNAGNYSPQLAGKRWEVPSLYQFLLIGTSLGKMKDNGIGSSLVNPNKFEFLIPSGAAAIGFTPSFSSINFPEMDMTSFENAFTKVGGQPIRGTYWLNTECQEGSEYKQLTIHIQGSSYRIDLKQKNDQAKIRPIIFY